MFVNLKEAGILVSGEEVEYLEKRQMWIFGRSGTMWEADYTQTSA